MNATNFISRIFGSAGVREQESQERESRERNAVLARLRKKVELPMKILGSTYTTCPDSGSEENIMSKDVTLDLGLKIEDSTDHQKEFRIANGKVVKSLGRTSVACAFAKDPSLRYQCWFYVFQSLITPIIMGMAFLHESETLTKYKYRLQSSMVPRNGPLRLHALNNPRRRLLCRVDAKATLANADTGSEIDLISLACAKRRHYSITKPSQFDTEVQFADGTTACLQGTVCVSISLKKHRIYPDVFSREEGSFVHTFYVLEGLTSDLLFGEEFLDEHKAFETYDTGFVTDLNIDICSQVNTIVWFKTPERFLARAFGRGRVTAPDPLSVEPGRSPEIQAESLLIAARRRVEHWLQRKFRSGDLENCPRSIQEPLTTFEARMDDRDARELHRRELAKKAIADLPDELKASAENEESMRLESYEDDKKRLLQARSGAQAGLILDGGLSGSSFATSSA